ncbi:PAS domain S-box protein [Mesorhizobium sp. WSM2561]|uniref:sensor histidine kinase n=1 Tax=Mesorhizobium sp. WSM2561 TaxID=1040985 RepID=UPI00048705B4|nr:PAS domain S-box protein [Mesorhizobium sp. WSM2561]
MGDMRRVGMLFRMLAAATVVACGILGTLFPTQVAGNPSQEFAQETSKGVIFLSSTDSTLPANSELMKGIFGALGADRKRDFAIYTEFLDAFRFTGDRQAAVSRRFIGEKYANTPLDVVIVVGSQALQFLRANGDEVFPGVPVVYAAIRPETIRSDPPPPNFVGIESRLDVAATVDLALTLQPEAKELIVVSGTADFDRNIAARAKADLQRFSGRLQLGYLSGLPIEDLLATVATLSRDSIVLYLSIMEDGTGRRFVPRDVAARLSGAAGAPVYSFYDTYVGAGIVGGHMDTFGAVGNQAGRIARRILDGDLPSEIASAGVTQRLIVDWRQLQRWGFDEASLPENAEIRHRPPSLWEQYHGLVLAAVTLLALQLLLIVALLVERHHRRQAKAQLRESEERMALAAQSANLGLWQWDLVHDRIWATDLCRKLLGIGPDKPLTLESLFDAVCPDDRARVRRTMEAARSTAEMYESEFRINLPGGDTRWIGTIGRSSLDARGKAVRMTGVLTDLTARKRAEEAIRESEERYRVVAETASDAIITIDSTSIILFANRATEKIFGYTVAEMVGNELTMLMPNHLRGVHRSSLARYLKDGRRHISWEAVELLGLHRDGQVIPLELSFAEYVSNGERRFTGIARNVSERKQAEEELRESEERYRNVVETQTELICRYLPDTTLTFVNDTYCRYFGRNREDLIGTRFIEFIPELARPATLQYVETLGTNPRTETYEHEVLRPDGSTGWQQWTDRAILNSTGKTIEIQGIGRDVTELKNAEKEAQQRREEVMHLTRVAVLGELSGALAHELNQPLSAILSNAQAARRMLGRDMPSLDDLMEILDDIIADDNRAGAVIQRLRALLKRGDTLFDSLDLNELVTDVLQLARSELVERRVVVTTALAPLLPNVVGDRIQLQQVLLNLVLNGCEAMTGLAASARRLTISTVQNGDGLVETKISDHGAGIESLMLEKIFEPFVTTKNGGLGLGLSICRSIITAHGGHLWASNNPDRGATFGFAIPMNSGGKH